MTKAQERIVVFAFGIVFIVALLTLAIKFPEPTVFQYEVFKWVLAIAVAGVSAMIPGFLEVNLPSWVKAGGALAVGSSLIMAISTALGLETASTMRSSA